MRTLKLIGIGLAPAVLIFCVAWLGGWNFERGFVAGYMAAVSIILGAIAVLNARGY